MSQTHNLDVQEAKYIVIDLFPAEVAIDGQSFGSANKVVLTDNRLYIIQEGPTGPMIAYQDGAGYSTFDRPNLQEYTVSTESGNFVEFRRAKNCACGSRLRGVYPFIGVPFAPRKPVSG